MSALELDHVFCFCESGVPEVDQAIAAGFTVDPGRAHQGQGTANRNLIFRENYLELIYLASATDAESNPMRLDRRADWRRTGASPFGVALRGDLTSEQRGRFWEYHPPYAPGRVILVHRQESDRLPVIFLTPPRGGGIEAHWPCHWPNWDQNLLKHANGARNIASVQIEGPGYRWPAELEVRGVSCADGKAPVLKVGLEGAQGMDVSIGPLLTLRST